MIDLTMMIQSSWEMDTLEDKLSKDFKVPSVTVPHM